MTSGHKYHCGTCAPRLVCSIDARRPRAHDNDVTIEALATGLRRPELSRGSNIHLSRHKAQQPFPDTEPAGTARKPHRVLKSAPHPRCGQQAQHVQQIEAGVGPRILADHFHTIRHETFNCPHMRHAIHFDQHSL
jgi:hypothetical protein